MISRKPLPCVVTSHPTGVRQAAVKTPREALAAGMAEAVASGFD